MKRHEIAQARIQEAIDREEDLARRFERGEPIPTRPFPGIHGPWPPYVPNRAQRNLTALAFVNDLHAVCKEHGLSFCADDGGFLIGPYDARDLDILYSAECTIDFEVKP